MKVIAAMIVHNELSRYLERVVSEALGYCDEVVAVDESSSDGSREWLAEQDRVSVYYREGPAWEESGGHEGHAREELLRRTLEHGPSHIVALDADEIVSDGAGLRAAMEASRPMVRAWALRIVEVWNPGITEIRVDGGWAPRWAPIAYRPRPGLTIYPMRLACPREPIEISRYFDTKRCENLDIDLAHLGWADPAGRPRRIARYMEQDGGDYHAREHLESIAGEAQLEPYGL